MIRLLKYLKPYLLNVALVVALLFLQANADLALPDYMSKIVNIGIQQSGISDSIPQAIRKDRLDKALLFMDAGGREKVKSAYDLVEAGTPSYVALAKKYPNSQGVALYSLKKLGQSERGDLSALLAKALSALEFLGQAQADPAKASQMAAGMGMNPSRLPAGMDLLAVLATMPEAQSAAIVKAINARFEGIDPTLIEQMGIKAVRDEYQLLGADIGRLQASYTLSMGGLMLLLTLLSVVSTIIVGYLGSRTAAGVARDLRKDLFSRVESFSLVELDKFSTASLITRSTNDITQVQMVTLMGLRMFFYAPIMGIGGVIRAMGKASSMWWIIALAVGILLALIITVFSISVPRFKSIQKLIDKLNLVVRENLSGMMVIRAFTMQDHEAKRFDKANRDLTGTMLFVTRVMVVMMPLMMLIMNLVSILILWTGAHEVAQSQIRIGDMMAFMQYSMQIFFSFLMLSMMFIILPRAAVSGDRIAEVLGTEPSIKDSAEPKHLPEPRKGLVEFRGVGFKYPGASEEVLRDVSFTAKPGETTAIIGTTGSGKSTLVSLIPRFYDCTRGTVSVDGVNVKDLPQKELRDAVGFVPQKASLFSGTIESNLLYAKESASAEDMKKALEIAQAMEFVESSPAGIAAEIAQGGGNVSGGQRQRLTIARALVKEAPIYIFDDSFSALDYRTDTRLRQALKAFVSDSTVLIVTQRVATIKGADQIIVLDEGKVVGMGKHHDLMETCEVYRDIALSQLKQEELA